MKQDIPEKEVLGKDKCIEELGKLIQEYQEYAEYCLSKPFDIGILINYLSERYFMKSTLESNPNEMFSEFITTNITQEHLDVVIGRDLENYIKNRIEICNINLEAAKRALLQPDMYNILYNNL